jgi:hypothetical protein
LITATINKFERIRKLYVEEKVFSNKPDIKNTML